MIWALVILVMVVGSFVAGARYGAVVGAEAYAELFAMRLKSEEYGHKVAAYINAFDHKLFDSIKKHL